LTHHRNPLYKFTTNIKAKTCYCKYVVNPDKQTIWNKTKNPPKLRHVNRLAHAMRGYNA